MAEINVKKKNNNSPNWPWILLILLAVGIVGWLLIDTGDDRGDTAYIQESEEQSDGFVTPGDNTETNNGQTAEDLQAEENEFGQNSNMQAQQGSNEQVESYVSFVKDNNDNIASEPNYSSRALNELANALSTLSEDANLQSDPDLQNLREQANQLQQNQSQDQQANLLSTAFTSAANVIDKVQKQNHPDLDEESEQVREAAQAVEPSQSLAEQEDKVKSFFEESADALEAMSR